MGDVDFVIRPLAREDREWVAHFVDQHWGSTQMVTRGKAVYVHLLPGFVAERPKPPASGSDRPDDDATEENPVIHMERVGLLTYNLEGKACEIITLDSLVPNKGIGTALVAELKRAAKEAHMQRLWCITTNDNLPALRFWQKRDFELVALYPNAIEISRRLKPQIPLTGLAGIPIRDEIELQYRV